MNLVVEGQNSGMRLDGRTFCGVEVGGGGGSHYSVGCSIICARQQVAWNPPGPKHRRLLWRLSQNGWLCALAVGLGTVELTRPAECYLVRTCSNLADIGGRPAHACNVDGIMIRNRALPVFWRSQAATPGAAVVCRFIRATPYSARAHEKHGGRWCAGSWWALV